MLNTVEKLEILEQILVFYPEKATAANSYRLKFDDKFFIIDPNRDLDSYLNNLSESALSKAGFLIATHCHYDHIKACDKIRRQIPIKFLAHRESFVYLNNTFNNCSVLFGYEEVYIPADELFGDGDLIKLYQDYYLRIIHCPGHSADSCLLLLYKDRDILVCFAGDTFMHGTIGRSDLPLSSAADLDKSLNKIVKLGLQENWPQDLPCLAGHGPISSWGVELAENPYLQKYLV